MKSKFPCRLIVMVFALFAAPFAQAAPQMVELNQVPCQFLESEQGVDQGFKSTNIRDCEAINDKTGAARLTRAVVLKLKPGKTVFRVTNKNVPYELGFWLRGATRINRITLPSVSGGGLTVGKTQDYTIDLKPGEYVYSCPLNPTPNYRLSVE